jgi:nucleoside diphosphate kinase
MLIYSEVLPGLIEYMTSGPVIAMVWEGKNAVGGPQDAWVLYHAD